MHQFTDTQRLTHTENTRTEYIHSQAYIYPQPVTHSHKHQVSQTHRGLYTYTETTHISTYKEGILQTYTHSFTLSNKHTQMHTHNHIHGNTENPQSHRHKDIPLTHNPSHTHISIYTEIHRHTITQTNRGFTHTQTSLVFPRGTPDNLGSQSRACGIDQHIHLKDAPAPARRLVPEDRRQGARWADSASLSPTRAPLPLPAPGQWRRRKQRRPRRSGSLRPADTAARLPGWRIGRWSTESVLSRRRG